ncbi:MAG: hypothetical protein II126_00255 [Erysipelotrichaceae bacterium]|nr:hypothetical protein [Erysipelotrichaceae bacterium]
MSKPKIRITDNAMLRDELERECSESDQRLLCRFALKLAIRMLEVSGCPYRGNDAVMNGFFVSSQWLKGKTGVNEVRQAAFRIHQQARESSDAVVSSVFRTVGHAVATAHVKEHAMAASDYAIKVVNLLHPDDAEAAEKERSWQIDLLRQCRIQQQKEG